MALVEWKDAYSVNETDLDNQHREFIRLINKLFDSVFYISHRVKLSRIT